MKVVVNGWSSDAHEIIAGVLQGSLLCSILFLLYINDLPTNTLRLIFDIYVIAYGCTSKYFDDQCLSPDLSSAHHLQLNSERTSESKLVTIHHCGDAKPAPILVSGYSHKEFPCLKLLLGINLTPVLKWNAYIHTIT